MNQLNKLAKLGLTPRKAALTAVLMVVWLIVLIAQFAPGDSSSPQTTLNKQPPARPEPTQGKTGQHKAHRAAEAPADPAPHQVRNWPEMTLEQVRTHNPFGVPAALAARATQAGRPGAEGAPAAGASDSTGPSAQRKQFLVELRRQGVSLVLLSDEQHVARIGERTVQVGDRIAGFQVEEIRPDGVVLVEDEGN